MPFLSDPISSSSFCAVSLQKYLNYFSPKHNTAEKKKKHKHLFLLSMTNVMFAFQSNVTKIVSKSKQKK